MGAANDWATWVIAALATAGVLVRPFAWPEFVWAITGAVLLVLVGLLPWHDALIGAGKGTDVYLFLTGMMLLAELARQEGLFDWIASRAARLSGGSAARLFTLIYAVGTLVTVFLSNDATAVVLTPAVAAVVRVAEAEPLPYLFTCAFIANAASFVLPISNPANLVIYGSHMPPLTQWLAQYAVPSIASVLATYLALRITQSRSLKSAVSDQVQPPPLAAGGRLAALGIAVTALVLLTASYFGVELGLPTFATAVATAAVVLLRARRGPWTVLREIPWGILPLVAGLFVLVQALENTGVTGMLAMLLQNLLQRSQALATWTVGLLVAFGCNLVNNLPAGLVAGRVVGSAPMPEQVHEAVLVGIDLGPNLSVTGSLATILWLAALRREGHAVSGLAFLRLGVVVMPPALLLALAAVFVR